MRVEESQSTRCLTTRLHRCSFLSLNLCLIILINFSINGSAQDQSNLTSSNIDQYNPLKYYPKNRKVVHHGVDDGLSQGTAYSILKDSRKFMWFTSYEGLNRFDGHQFKVYSENPGDCNSIKGSTTFGLVEDPHGNMWVGSDVCLNLYLREFDHFESMFAKDSKGESINSVNYPFYADSSEVWYINDKEGIQAFNFIEKEKRVITPHLLYRHSSYIINSTILTSDGMIWYRDEKGLARVDPENGDQEWYFSDKEENVFGEPLKLICFYQDENDIIWLGYEKGIIRFDFELQQYDNINLESHISTPINDIKRDQLGFFWLGTEQDGLLRYSETNGVHEHYKAEGPPKHRLSSNAIATVFIDDQNLIWVNSDPEGINVLVPDLKPFKKHTSDIFDPDEFSTTGVRTFLETNRGNVWIGTQEDGLIVFDPTTEKIVRQIMPGKNGFTPNSATSMLQDKNGRIWIGTYDGLYLSSDQGQSFRRISNNNQPQNLVSSNFIGHILEAGDETIFFTTESGIYYIRPGELIPAPIDTLQQIISRMQHLTSDGFLLVAENHRGFYVLKASEWTSESASPAKVLHFLSQFNINHFYEDNKNSTIWLATAAGLVKLRHEVDWSEVNIEKHFTRENGLPSNYIYGILPDKYGNLWMSTNRGISSFNPETERFTNYSIEDGLQGFEFNSNSFLETSSGEFYFGGTNGFNRFLPEFRINTIPPSLQIIQFKTNDEILNSEHYIGEQESVHLPSSGNTFSIEFSAIDYLSSGQNQYQVMLENYDNAWTNIGNENTIRYTKVPHGEYTFKVKASNNDGFWSEDHKSLQIQIATPWNKSWWAFMGYLILGGLIIYTIYNVRKRRFTLNQQLISEQREASRLKELNEYKSRFYSNITHEFRTPLTVIEGMADELKSNPDKLTEKNLDLIKKNSKSLLILVNQMLDLSKINANKVESNYLQDDIIVFLRYVAESHGTFASLQNIGLQFHSEELELIMDFDHKKLERVLTNLLSNAIKFTPEKGKILVVVKKIEIANNPHLQILVKDSGKGIFNEQLPYIFDRFYQADSLYKEQGTGLGLSLAKELVELMNGGIYVESELNKGSKFYINLPINNSALLADSKNELWAKSNNQLSEKEIQKDAVEDDGLPIVLIIEDNPDVAYYIQSCLTNRYQTIVSHNGKIGMEKALEVLPDLIISDVMMPEMSGFEVCKTLKEDERSSHIPIILLTAKATSEDKLEGLTQGADAYLIKPFEKAELLIRLEKLILIRKTLQKKYSSMLLSSQVETSNATKEDAFILKTEKIILEHLDQEDFSIHNLARELHLSRSQLHRKIKALTNMSTSIYVRHVRLRKAIELLNTTSLSISEIAYQVGFKSPVYFSQVFKETFGESPSTTRI